MKLTINIKMLKFKEFIQYFQNRFQPSQLAT